MQNSDHHCKIVSRDTNQLKSVHCMKSSSQTYTVSGDVSQPVKFEFVRKAVFRYPLQIASSNASQKLCHKRQSGDIVWKRRRKVGNCADLLCLGTRVNCATYNRIYILCKNRDLCWLIVPQNSKVRRHESAPNQCDTKPPKQNHPKVWNLLPNHPKVWRSCQITQRFEKVAKVTQLSCQ